MKANEAPEKIYVADVTFPDYVDFDGSPINTKRIDEHDIEYTRTDAFIEKAEKAMIEWASTYISKTTGGGVRERKAFATDLLNYFKKYIEGE